jgi:hypothetical protein
MGVYVLFAVLFAIASVNPFTPAQADDGEDINSHQQLNIPVDELLTETHVIKLMGNRGPDGAIVAPFTHEISITISLTDVDIVDKVAHFCHQHEVSANSCLHFFFRNVMQKQYFSKAIPAADIFASYRRFSAIVTHDVMVSAIFEDVKETESIEAMQLAEQRTFDYVVSDIFPAASQVTEGTPINEVQHEMKQRICVIHSTSLQHQSHDILRHLLDTIITSGLIHELQYVLVFNYGGQIPLSVQQEYAYGGTGGYRNIHFMQVAADPTHSEVPTLRILHMLAAHLDKHADPPAQHATADPAQHGSSSDTSTPTTTTTQILYLHTKGVTYFSPNRRISDWTDMMLHFLVQRHRSCYALLASDYNVLGVNYYTNAVTDDGDVDVAPPHFSGNFWWATSRYLSGLARLEHSVDSRANKYSAESWVLTDGRGEAAVYCPYKSYENHYRNEHPRELYVNV